MSLEYRLCFSRSQEKNYHRGNTIYKWLKCVHTHTRRDAESTLSSVVMQPCPWTRAENQEGEFTFGTDKSHCLAFLYSLFWSKAASPITFSLDTASHCQHRDWRKLFISCKSNTLPSFCLFQEISSSCSITWSALPYLIPISEMGISKP